MSNPGTPLLQRPEALKKLAQLRIERLKKEEEEEQWISGEELYTEGSSDEDDMAVRTKRKSNEKGGKKSSKSVGSKPKKQVKDEIVKSPNSLSLPQISLPCASSKDGAVQKQQSDSERGLKDATENKIEKEGALGDVSNSTSALTEDEEIEPEISWRPKRGSIKLPNLTTEGRVELLGDENARIMPIQSAENAYKIVVEKVNKLKDILSNETNIVAWINESNANGFFGNINFNSSSSCVTNNKNTIHNSKNLIKESCDVDSALKNIKILDHLIDIITSKEKEAREKTIDVELKIREELDHLCNSNHLECCGDGDGADDELLENTSSFLQLFSLKDESDISKVKKIFAELKHKNLSEDTELDDNDLQFNNEQKIKCFDVDQSKQESNIETEDVSLISHLEDVNVQVLNEEDRKKIPTLTDEEKQRLLLLLQDSENDTVNVITNSNNGENFDKSYSSENQNGDIEAYQMNNRTKEDLEEINEKLKVYTIPSKEKTCGEKLSYIPSSAKELLNCNEFSEGNYEEQCLKNIDELLDVLNKPLNEEIHPLTREEIQDLIMKHPDTCKGEEQSTNFNTLNNSKDANKTEPVQKVDSEILQKLIEEAKTAMPQFKFKYSV